MHVKKIQKLSINMDQIIKHGTLTPDEEEQS